jgi:hypothetical protein
MRVKLFLNEMTEESERHGYQKLGTNWKGSLKEKKLYEQRTVGSRKTVFSLYESYWMQHSSIGTLRPHRKPQRKKWKLCNLTIRNRTETEERYKKHTKAVRSCASWNLEFESRLGPVRFTAFYCVAVAIGWSPIHGGTPCFDKDIG